MGRPRTAALPNPCSIIRDVPGPDNTASSVTQLTACLNSSTFSSALVNWKYITRGFRKLKHSLQYFAQPQRRATCTELCTGVQEEHSHQHQHPALLQSPAHEQQGAAPPKAQTQHVMGVSLPQNHPSAISFMSTKPTLLANNEQ